MRIIAIVTAVLAMLGFMSPSGAASFDCDDAHTAFETTICSDAALSQLDEVLAVAYDTAIAALDKRALQAMRNDQRQWLEFVADVCLGDRRSGLSSGADCIRSEYRRRFEVLEQSRMQGGYRFYVRSSYFSAPDPVFADDPESPFGLATHVRSSPRIDGGGAVGRAFNNMVQALGEGVGLGPFGETGPDDTGTDVNASITVSEVTSRRISLTINDWWYGHGAAHGNYTISHAHFLLEEGRSLQPSDVFTGEDWVEPLAEATLAALEAEHGDALWALDAADMAELVADPARWTFAAHGIEIQFQPYEVSSYAYGAPTGTVNWDAIENHLAEGAYTLSWLH